MNNKPLQSHPEVEIEHILSLRLSEQEYKAYQDYISSLNELMIPHKERKKNESNTNTTKN